jgi:hypothetical protein
MPVQSIDGNTFNYVFILKSIRLIYDQIDAKRNHPTDVVALHYLHPSAHKPLLNL